MRKLKISVMICICLFLLLQSSCGNTQTISGDIEEKIKFETFDVDKQSIISLFEQTGRYVETNLHEFENDEKNTCGTIHLNPEDYDNLFADENIYTEVRTYKDKILAAKLTYDISGDEEYYEKLPELTRKVLSAIKPNANIEETILTEFGVKTDAYYSKDFEDLRYIVSYEEWGAAEIRIEITIIHLDDSTAHLNNFCLSTIPLPRKATIPLQK